MVGDTKACPRCGRSLICYKEPSMELVAEAFGRTALVAVPARWWHPFDGARCGAVPMAPRGIV